MHTFGPRNGVDGTPEHLEKSRVGQQLIHRLTSSIGEPRRSLIDVGESTCPARPARTVEVKRNMPLGLATPDPLFRQI